MTNSSERQLLGGSPKIEQVRERIRLVRSSRATVILSGETGTGKEVAARSIHWPNPARFVPIDCGALAGSLVESELFGHTQGAFTGALKNKPGLFEAAQGGTAFLDEIGELSMELQTRLLRVLQEKEYRPLGSVTTRRFDARIIAATHRDLAKRVEMGLFRQDLYYRLKVVTVHLPPLREHREDIPELARYFLNQFGAGEYRITVPAMDLLMKYDWPGNVRELHNCIEQMVALNSGPVLDFEDIPDDVRSAAFDTRSVGLNAMPEQPDSKPTLMKLADVERQMIVRAVKEADWDRSRAALLLGIGRTTLYRKLKEYDLEDACTNRSLKAEAAVV